MSEEPVTFLERCLQGYELIEDIEDFVDRWHDEPKLQRAYPKLYSYLGMDRDEYASWVEEPASLEYIIFAHKQGISLTEALEMSSGQQLAARSSSPGEALRLRRWLERTGRI